MSHPHLECEIESLYHYPVKSCAGIALPKALCGPSGIEHDREWMVVDERGMMQTQRKRPDMALIQPRVESDQISLSHPRTGRCPVALSARSATVSIWKDHVDAAEADDEVGRWLTETLESRTPLRLVRFQTDKHRTPGQPQRFRVQGQHFADAAPLLLSSSASLAALNTHLEEAGIDAVTMSHFRPNIVLKGLPAFSEHQFRLAQHVATGHCFELVDACQRCVMVTVNPDTGERRKDASPFKQLTALNPMPDNPRAPAFGINVCNADPQAPPLSVSVGDKLVLMDALTAAKR